MAANPKILDLNFLPQIFPMAVIPANSTLVLYVSEGIKIEADQVLFMTAFYGKKVQECVSKVCEFNCMPPVLFNRFNNCCFYFLFWNKNSTHIY